MDIEIVGKAVLDAAFRVHSILGPGLLESIYEAALARELTKRGHKVERQKPIPVFYDGELLEEVGFRADMIADGVVLVELKSVTKISEQFKKTTETYVRMIPLRLGFLLNFGEAHLRDGIIRIVNGTDGKPFFQK